MWVLSWHVPIIACIALYLRVYRTTIPGLSFADKAINNWSTYHIAARCYD